MIEQGVLIIWPPTRAAHIIDLDFDHLLDAVDDARNAHLFLLWRRRWTRLCLWLLWHLRSPFTVSEARSLGRAALNINAQMFLPVALPHGRASDTLCRYSAFRCRQRCFENPWVGSAATEVSFARFAHLLKRRIRVLLQVTRDRGHKPGSAEAAHQTVVLDKGALHGVHMLGRTQTFNGGQFFPDRVNCEYQTRVDILAIHQHGTG